MICDEAETNTFQVQIKEVKESHNNNMYACTMTMSLQSDKYLHLVVPGQNKKAFGREVQLL
jgi:peroxiredoxin family protein